ncbi:DMT family transporter [Arenibaculum sp.]|uniref:DMT family transporter n=1 Tax=Arenibaculum sp. TaxID=2865862 RepID=UPI002E143066|nr:DMT family transporter [Arenibaculum sp.]
MTPERRNSLDFVAIAAMVVICLTWGGQQVAIKLANEGVPPIFQAALRSCGALILVGAWSVLRGDRIFARDGTLIYGIVIGTLFSAEFILLYVGLTYTSASRSVVFQYASPFFVAIAAHVLIPGERIRPTSAVGLACAFMGLGIVFSEAFRLPDSDELVGDVMVLGSAALWAAVTIIIKVSPLARISAGRTLFYQLSLSSVILFAVSYWVEDRESMNFHALVVGALLYQVVVVAFLSYLAWFWMVTVYPAGRLSAFSFLTPLFGMLLASVILGEEITAALGFGGLLVAVGVYLVNREPRGLDRPARVRLGRRSS